MRGHFLAELGVCAAHLRDVLCEPVALGAEGLLFVGADVGGGGAHATGGFAAAGVPHTRAGERCELGVEVAQHVADVRGSYAKLREEVTAHLGGTPSWWIELPTRDHVSGRPESANAAR